MNDDGFSDRGVQGMTVTAKMIAKELGVSPSAVSLALNGKSGISEETRKNIIEKASEMGYFSGRFNPVEKQPGNIRFVVYNGGKDVLNEIPFYSYVLRGIENRAKEQGYNILVSYFNSQSITQEDAEELCRGVDGILVMGTELHREDFAGGISLKKLPCPVVVIDNGLFGDKIDSVVTDNLRGAFKAIEYLVKWGHTKIGYLCSRQRIPNFDERSKGVELAQKEYPDVRIEQIPVNFATKKSVADIEEWIRNTEELPTALFADSDMIAFGAIQALTGCGYRIPEDISVIGFDDMDACRLVNPPLTTIQVMKLQMGMAAFTFLENRIEGKLTVTGDDAFFNVTVTTKVKERKSVSRPAR